MRAIPILASPAQSIALFDPLVDTTAIELAGDPWTATGDGLACGAMGGFCQLKRAANVQYGIAEVGVDIASRPMTPQHQVAIAVFQTPLQPHYYVEVFDDGVIPGYAAISRAPMEPAASCRRPRRRWRWKCTPAR